MFASAVRELEHPDKNTLHVVRVSGSIKPRMTFNARYFPYLIIDAFETYTNARRPKFRLLFNISNERIKIYR